MAGIDRQLVLRAFARRGSIHALREALFWAMAFILAAAACSSSASPSDRAYTYRKLHSFCSKPHCRDGSEPDTALLADPMGNLYGTTVQGGGVYELKLEGNKRLFEIVHGFSDIPDGNLIMDITGNLYCTTGYGGEGEDGTVFDLSPQTGRSSWKLTNLYEFCRRGNSCSDGAESFTGLTYAGAAAGQEYDGTSPLYGTTVLGGATDHGTLFEFEPPKQGKAWTERVLYSFCSRVNCADGYYPSETPIVDQWGDIYGATAYGGKDGGGGVVYELSPAAKRGSWKEKVIRSFPNGGRVASLLIDGTGDIYGVAAGGGENGKGMFFELFRSGRKWKLSALYSFCMRQNCADGTYPLYVVMDATGDFYGATVSGGARGDGGAVFKLVPDGSKWKLSVRYSFCSQAQCADGDGPVTVTLGSGGNLFGTTQSGGRGGEDGAGVAYELKAR